MAPSMADSLVVALARDGTMIIETSSRWGHGHRIWDVACVTVKHGRRGGL